MKYTIRELKQEEVSILETFLYEAIFIPEGVEAPPREIVRKPELQVYITDFGKHRGDNCLVCECDGKIAGAVWTRIMDDYGHVDNNTPSFAISLLKEFRKQGIGTQMMRNMLLKLKQQGYRQASLSVQKENYAARMYMKLGFETIKETDDEYLMVCRLQQI